MSPTSKKIFADIESLGSADRYIENVAEVIGHIALFDDFSEEEIRALAHYMTCYAAPKITLCLPRAIAAIFYC